MSIFKVPQAFAQTPEELVGELDIPKGVDVFNEQSGGSIGIILFISNLITFFMILGGIWTLLNLIFAAFAYLTGGGKADSHTKVRDRFTMSVMGLIIMIAAYSVAAIIGMLFYGDPNYIITPTIERIGQ